MTHSSLITHHPSLTPWQRRGLWALLAGFMLFGGLVELRSAFLKRRMTDLGVYLRAAWAVRAGENIYDVTDNNGWHYQYPPCLAILLTPLADPPAGVECPGALPFSVSVATWYVLNLLCLVFAVHKLAQALESDSADPRVPIQPVGCRRWWALRIGPVLVCLVPICQTLMRGQVTLLLLALLAGMVAAWQRRRHLGAGLWLAGAVCLKVIPAFLILIPLWQRNRRCLVGCALGLLLGLVALPAMVFGWPRTLAYYGEYDRKVLRPGVGATPLPLPQPDSEVRAGSHTHGRATELFEVTSTDSQSLQAIIHNWIYQDRWTRPAYVSALIRGIHYAVGGLLTLITLLAFGRRQRRSALALVIFLGALTFNMLLLSPVTHLHYLCLCLPLVMGLWAAVLERGFFSAFQMRCSFLLVVFCGAGIIPTVPGMETMRDIGLAMDAAFLLWLAGCRFLWTEERNANASANLSQERHWSIVGQIAGGVEAERPGFLDDAERHGRLAFRE